MVHILACGVRTPQIACHLFAHQSHRDAVGIPADAVSRADPTKGAGESADDDPRGPDVADTGRGGAGAP